MYQSEHPIINCTADVVLLYRGYYKEVLLVKRSKNPFKGGWALPGGFIDVDEYPSEAAALELREETGIHLDPTFLKFVGTYADPGRDTRGRVISFAFVATINYKPAVIAGDDAAAAKWHNTGYSLDLAFDHNRILTDALRKAD